MAMAESLHVEVAFATPERQKLVALKVERGATVADAIRESGLQALFSQVDFNQLEAGIWGRVVERGAVLSEGDRVELYRPLARDPRDARRELARVQRLGSSS
jgi:putative ubiquitin-RnfH superfamily antitoxin RatB of RatAB toxin-antitoxin module